MSVAAITWAMQRRLGSATLKYVLLALANHADDDGKCWPSQEHLAGTTELSIRSVRRSLVELEERCLIHREERPRRDDKTRRSDLIQLRLYAASDHAVTVAGSSEDHAATVTACPDMRPGWPDDHAATVAGTMRPHSPDHAATVAGSYKAEPSIEPSVVEPSDSCPNPKRARTGEPKYPSDFEEQFWRPYPTTPTMSKKQAGAEWARLNPTDRAAAIAAVPRYRIYLASKPDHPVVHACRFLSQRRFDGFAEAATKPSETAGQYYAAAGSLQLAAWTEHRRVTDGKTGLLDSRGGWTFPSEWPPTHEHARAAPRVSQAEHLINAHFSLFPEDRSAKADRRAQAMGDVIGLDEDDAHTIEGELL